MPANSLPPFAALRAFEMVGRTGGIRRAAAALGVSHTIVGRHLAALEAFLGVVLFNRATGTLTDAGSRYFARISAAIGEMEAATIAIGSKRGRSLVIGCSAGFSLHWLTHRLPQFAERVRNPAAPLIELRSIDPAPSFDAEEVDCDIVYLRNDQIAPSPPGIRVEEIVRPQLFPVAAPAFVAKFGGDLRNRADILRLPLIEEASDAEWSNWLAAQGLDAHGGKAPVARYGQAHLAMVAARAGQGVALAVSLLVADDLANGRLVRVTPSSEAWESADLGAYYFRCSRARWSEPLMGRFRRWLQQSVARD